MISKLKSLRVKFTSIEVNKIITLLENLEKITGILPKDYHNFLLCFGSNVKFYEIIIFKGIESSPWADSKGFDTIDYFYGLNNINDDYTIFEMIKTYKNDLKMELITIGCSSGGIKYVYVPKEMRKEAYGFGIMKNPPFLRMNKLFQD